MAMCSRRLPGKAPWAALLVPHAASAASGGRARAAPPVCELWALGSQCAPPQALQAPGLPRTWSKLAATSSGKREPDSRGPEVQVGAPELEPVSRCPGTGLLGLSP